jgi:acyl-coenzyme A thioesterase PaaI-like protein
MNAAGAGPTAATASPGQRVLALWRRLAPLPFGRTMFMSVFGRMVPYSGALGARVVSLEPGHVVLVLRDRRGVRNHLRSVHAIALANLGELASGLAMTTALPPGVRSIVTALTIEFGKKARGVLTAESRVTVPAVDADVEHDVRAEIRDAAGEVVATVTVRWRLGLVPAS